MRLVLFTLLPLLLVGCSAHFTRENLVGKYVLSGSAGTGTIELKDGGTYVHSFQNKDGASATQSGKWELENLDAGPTVTLNDFEPLAGEQERGQGFYLLRVRNFFGKIT